MAFCFVLMLFHAKFFLFLLLMILYVIIMKNTLPGGRVEGKTFMCVDIMRQLLIFRGISDAHLRLICDVAKPFTAMFQKDDVILAQEDYWECFGVIESGYVMDMRSNVDSKTQLLRSHWPTSVINLEGAASDFRTSPTEIKATTDGSVIWFPYNAIAQSKEIPTAVRELFCSNAMKFVIDDSIRFMNKLFVMSWRQTRDRIIAFMSVLRRKSKDDMIHLGMTQEEFAQYLCVDVSTLTETLNKMKREGLIDYERQSKNGIYRVNFFVSGVCRDRGSTPAVADAPVLSAR
jgi:CRP-like cAMP-binding protein